MTFAKPLFFFRVLANFRHQKSLLGPLTFINHGPLKKVIKAHLNVGVTTKVTLMAWTAHASSATREGGLRRRTSSCSSRIGAGRAREASPLPSSPFDFECCSFVFLKEIKPEHGGVYFLSAKGTYLRYARQEL
jgi:hypothetical protein